MSDDIHNRCASIFREVSGLTHSAKWSTMPDSELLVQPMDAFDIDSLTMTEFVMRAEDEFGVLLDEEAVNGCRTLAEFSGLVAAARHG